MAETLSCPMILVLERLVMKKLAAIWFLLMLLVACGGTEIDKNPAPIVWDKVTLAPSVIERSPNGEVWRDVAVTGYGLNGTISLVTITPQETIAEDIAIDGYSAKKEIWRDVKGDYQKALNMFMATLASSGEAPTEAPDVTIGFHQAYDLKVQKDGGVLQVGFTEASDSTPNSCGKSKTDDLAVFVDGSPMFSAKTISVDKVYVPGDPEKDFAKIVVDGFVINEASCPYYGGKAERVCLDFANGEFKFAVDKFTAPSHFLGFTGLVDLPETLNASLAANGEYNDSGAEASATLYVDKLFDMKADGFVKNQTPIAARLNFQLKDIGAIDYLSEDSKEQLVLIAQMFPDGGEALAKFITTPGRILAGIIDITGNEKRYTFSVQ